LAGRKARKAQAMADYEKAKDEGDAETMQKMADRTTTVFFIPLFRAGG